MSKQVFFTEHLLFFLCAQHGRTPTGASPVASWSRRAKWSATAWGRPSVGRKRGT